MIPVLAASWLLSFILILIGIAHYDRILKIFHERFPELWKESGAPKNLFDFGNEDYDWIARDKILMKLPCWWNEIEWIEKDAEAKRLRKRIQIISFSLILITVINLSAWISLYINQK